MNRREALKHYWSAQNREEQRLAYYELLLCGAVDGYAEPTWRRALARWFRLFAFKIEGDR